MEYETGAARGDDGAGGARERVLRQIASIRTSAGWLLGILERHSALLPAEEASAAFRLRRAARTLSWHSREQERLAFFGERCVALEAEAEQALAAPDARAPDLADLARRIEQASAEALAFYVSMQNEAARAAELSGTAGEEENSPARTAARAEIGAAVRARLAERGAAKLWAIGLDLYRVRGLLDAGECSALIALIERDLHPSAVLGEGISGFRTSKSCNLTPTDAPVETFESRAADLLGVNRRFTETVQGQRYEVGQEFRPHHDFFHWGESYYQDVALQGGQRTWTAMMFLNEPEAGGHTNFPTAGAQVAPEAGTLIVWNNMQSDGKPNPYSLHQGMPVEAGVKYVLTKWFRERPLAY